MKLRGTVASFQGRGLVFGQVIEGKAFEQVEKWDSSLALDYLWKQAAAQLSVGQGQGDPTTIKTAIATYDQAAVIFDKMSLTPEYPEFLTLPLYEAMA